MLLISIITSGLVTRPTLAVRYSTAKVNRVDKETLRVPKKKKIQTSANKIVQNKNTWACSWPWVHKPKLPEWQQLTIACPPLC